MARRTGLIAKKIGMTSWFTEDAKKIAVTVLKVEDCVVVGRRTEKDGYNALILGSDVVSINKISKPSKSLFKDIEPRSVLREFRVDPDVVAPISTVFTADHFQQGQYIDVVGTSIGKGFAGVMKRHNFRGLEASHGVSISHRSHGSTGGRQDPGKVFKGKKMAGHLGDQRVTIQNLEIVSVISEKGLLLIRGAVPGAKNSHVIISDAKKKNC